MDAFVEQLRLKDEKLETYRWRLLSMELESKRLESHVEGLNKDMAHLRHNNMKLEALLLEREEELTSLKEQFASQLRFLNSQKNLNSTAYDSSVVNDPLWHKFNIISRKADEEDQNTKRTLMEQSQEQDIKKEEETPSSSQCKDVILKIQSPDKEFEVDKDVAYEGTSQGEVKVQWKLMALKSWHHQRMPQVQIILCGGWIFKLLEFLTRSRG
ncbi:CAP-Gly domain-containing linker protein 1 isoform X2 [Prunus yedoensis var. nudiflora]|uniref:CAP-Gly domain-containing linker protein 1 isoform X2 n=1 Tax=Prunus yedoensis var. nudiflora TaxID=2094558 RepID=A0A314YIA3_PRUYE|nr:CAP-Gly domain-containing linker protein 1 isoform X2 [Prunus yedoensis var. nudiflora]